jgi:hypothetical protein
MLAMRRHFLLACQLFVLGFLVYWNNVLGLNSQMYFTVSWWDVVSHILGGLWVALCVAWIATFFKRRLSIIECVALAFGVGVAWEIFEYVNGMGGSIFMSYQLDTAKDLLDDAIGGLIAGYFVNKFRK